MEVIRQKLRTSAVLEERNRIARELHDTLEQELAGITLQLDLAVDSFQGAPRIAQQAVETARNMSRHSMIEARRSVWDLRCQLLENGDLVSALSQIVEPLGPRDGRIVVKIEGEHVRLPSPMEMNLLRIGQEAVANAVKHGGARSILVELCYRPELRTVNRDRRWQGLRCEPAFTHRSLRRAGHARTGAIDGQRVEDYQPTNPRHQCVGGSSHRSREDS